MDMDEFERLVEIAHGAQVDKAGYPYFAHCVRVRDHAAGILASLPDGLVDAEEAETILMAALAHDVVEDTALTGEDLLARGVRSDAVSIVKAVSNNGWTGTYAEKIASIASGGHLGTIVVKLADNTDNRDPARMALVPGGAPPGLVSRYAKARTVLESGLDRAVALRLHETEKPGI